MRAIDFMVWFACMGLFVCTIIAKDTSKFFLIFSFFPFFKLRVDRSLVQNAARPLAQYWEGFKQSGTLDLYANGIEAFEFSLSPPRTSRGL